MTNPHKYIANEELIGVDIIKSLAGKRFQDVTKRCKITKGLNQIEKVTNGIVSELYASNCMF